MKLLAIDTSSEACSVALLFNGEIKVLHKIVPRQQAKLILPMIEQLLNEADMTLNQLHALAFGCGPGSFTGVRIATSVAQGIGYAMNLPLIPISSLAAIAQSAYENKGWKQIYVAIDARINELYCGMYQINTDGLAALVGKEILSTPEKMIIPDSPEWCGVGNGWDIYSNQIQFKLAQIDSTHLPNATGVLSLAKQKYNQGDVTSAENALPTYLREEVAKKS